MTREQREQLADALEACLDYDTEYDERYVPMMHSLYGPCPIDAWDEKQAKYLLERVGIALAT